MPICTVAVITMATTRRLFIIATIILACAALALTVTSLVTSFWVAATLSDPDGLFKTSDINYGLFVGHIGGERVVQVDMDLSSKPRRQQRSILLVIVNMVTGTVTPTSHTTSSGTKGGTQVHLLFRAKTFLLLMARKYEFGINVLRSVTFI
jgi:hypothetical protein